VRQYIAGLNQAIKAGSDVRTIFEGISSAVINIAIDEKAKDLLVTYLNNRSPFDKKAHVPLRTQFTVEFNDYPNEIRDAEWK
jgi:hypothetical protein